MIDNTQRQILYAVYLYTKEPKTINELAKMMHIDKKTFKELVDDLATKQLVRLIRENALIATSTKKGTYIYPIIQ